MANFITWLPPEIPRDIAFIPSILERVQSWRASWLRSKVYSLDSPQPPSPFFTRNVQYRSFIVVSSLSLLQISFLPHCPRAKINFFSYTFFQSTSSKLTRGEWEFLHRTRTPSNIFIFRWSYFPRQRFRYFSDFLFSSFLFSSPCWMFSTTFLPACPWPCSPVLLFCPASFFDFPFRECPAECRLSS